MYILNHCNLSFFSDSNSTTKNHGIRIKIPSQNPSKLVLSILFYPWVPFFAFFFSQTIGTMQIGRYLIMKRLNSLECLIYCRGSLAVLSKLIFGRFYLYLVGRLCVSDVKSFPPIVVSILALYRSN